MNSNTFGDLVTALSNLAPTAGFCASSRVAPETLSLEVTGVGKIRLPISPATARRLRMAGSKARFGLRDQTLEDVRVRHSSEIPAVDLRIDERRFAPFLHAQLTKLAPEMGLGPEVELKAELHNLLVYERGQFFAPHQDSEKRDGMIGTLVVILPSRFSGGELVVEQHGQTIGHEGSPTELTFVAFYADCQHEVRRIHRGHRVALTYNLIAAKRSPATVTTEASPAYEAALRRLRAHFAAPRRSYRGSQNDGQSPPDRLVYLLDHEYTQSGLDWDLLKNADGRRAAALKKLAAELDFEVSLALADVHEQWSCEDDWCERNGRRRWDEDRCSSSEDEEYRIVDRINWSVELRHWVSGEGQRTPGRPAVVPGSDVCFNTPSDALVPFKSEHERYMGNYGNTVDRWYHRAAVVLWPRERTFILRAKDAPLWALREIARALKAGNLDEARDLVRQVEPFWESRHPFSSDGVAVSDALRVAEQLCDEDLAARLLRPLRLDQLDSTSALELRALCQRYGTEWCLDRLGEWNARPANVLRDEWIATVLPELCRRLVSSCGESEQRITRRLVATQLEWIEHSLEHISPLLSWSYFSERLSGIQSALLGLRESAHFSGSPELNDHASRLVSVHDQRLGSWCAELLAKARESFHEEMPDSIGVPRVEEHCSGLLLRKLVTANAKVSSLDWVDPASFS